jgi:anti-anti-sigma factor
MDDAVRDQTRVWGVHCSDGQILWVEDEPAARRVLTSLVGADRIVRRTDQASPLAAAAPPPRTADDPDDPTTVEQATTQAAGRPRSAPTPAGMPDTYVIHARNRIDLTVVDALRTASFDTVDADLPKVVIIDLTDVLVLDTIATTALIQLRRHLTKRHAVLLLRGAAPRLQRMLAVTGMDRIFPDAGEPTPAIRPTMS